jgi:hypothetical protein
MTGAMDTLIQGFFAGVLYPALVLAVMVSLIASVVYFIVMARRGEQRMRCAIAALLPVIALTFFMASPASQITAWEAAFAGRSLLWNFCAGAALGVLLTLACRLVTRWAPGIGAPYYVAVLSAITCLFLFLLRGGAQQSIASALLGAALGAGVWFAFLGLPFRVEPRKQPP